jgi:hypothetical protein
MAKYYFQKDAEMCYTLDDHIDQMRFNNIKEMVVYEAKIERGTGFFYCREFGEVGEVGESCGRLCDKYAPMNGKSGKCKHAGNVYMQTDVIKTLTI